MDNKNNITASAVSSQELNQELKKRKKPLPYFLKTINEIIQFKKPIPKVLYFLPLFLWASMAIPWLNRDNLSQSIASNLINNPFAEELNTKTSAIANALQEDINFISEKVADTDIFEMTKDEMIEETERSSFLLKKGKRLLEKNTAAQSEGQYDYKDVYFDSTLNIHVFDNALIGQDTDINAPKEPVGNELIYEMDKFKEESPTPNRAESAVAIIERNRQKRLALEKDDIETSAKEAKAYQQGVEDYYRKQSTYQEYSTPSNFTSSNSKNQSKSKLGFHTASGIKNQLDRSPNADSKPTTSTNNSVVIESNTNEIMTGTQKRQSIVIDYSKDNIIKAIIDQGQKLKNGNKVQIRVIEDSYYYPGGINNKSIYLFLPQNTLLYGVCSMNQSRLKISIPSIQIPDINNQIYSSNLIVYDMDGMEGIYIDGTHNEFTRDAISQALNSGSSGLGLRNGLGTFSLNLGKRANRNTKVYVPSGYPILLLQR